MGGIIPASRRHPVEVKSLPYPLSIHKGGGRRLPEVALRQLAVSLTRRLAGLSLPETARRYGLRDHTTALHGIRRMRSLMAILELELGEEDPVERWVERALPLLDEHIAEIRRRHRSAQRTENGKFVEGYTPQMGHADEALRPT
jgi:hypothetical protein